MSTPTYQHLPGLAALVGRSWSQMHLVAVRR